MEKSTIFKAVGSGIGFVTAVSLVSTMPYHVVALAVGAAVYFYGDKVVK